jgi:myo-inositol 2-dehydrogenase/D-chiro-inositol 1-dehydrogenase
MLRFALFGAGFIGSAHAANLARHPNAELAVIYDVVAANAEALARRHDVAVAPTADAIWDDVAIDAVLIASSTDTHAALLTRAAETGKAALCEKPIDLSLERVKGVAHAVVEAGIPVGIGFSRRFDRDHAALQRAVAAGEIGRVELMQLSARGPTPPPIAYVKVSGGQLRDQTIHQFDLARWIAGDEVVSVYARGACLIDPAIGKAGDVDTSVVVLSFAGGALAMLDSSRRAAYGYDERIEAFGSEGLLISERKPTGNVTRYVGKRSERPGLHPGWFERIEESFYAALDAFVGALEAGTPPSPSLDDGIRAQLIAEAAVRSLASGREEPVEAWESEG